MKTITRVLALAIVLAFNVMTSVMAQPYTYTFQRTRGITIEVMTPEAFNASFGDNPDVPKEDGAIIALAERLFPPQGQPRPSRGEVGQSGTYEVGVLFAALKNPAIDPATRATVDSIMALSEPPLPKTYTSGHFRFFYTDNDPDPRNNSTLTQIKKTAVALNASWNSYSSNFKNPKAYLDGDKEMVDIKVYWLERLDDKGNIINDLGFTGSHLTYIALNSQLTVANDCMSKITAAHELFHRVQFAYKLVNITSNMLWLVEGSATWSHKYRHASIRDYMYWMNKGLTKTDPSIGFMQRAYDTVHFWVYLEKRWGWEAIKEIWTKFEESNDHDAKAAVDAVDTVLGKRNSSFDQFVGEWALTNYVKDTANSGIYDYDEDEISKTSCGVPYGPLVSVPALPKNPIIITKNARPWVITTFVRPYNADYYQFGIDPGVTGIDLKLDGKDTGSFRYYVLGMKNNSVIEQFTPAEPGDDPDYNYDWGQIFPAGRYDKIAVVVVGMGKGGSYKINIKPKTKLSIGDTWQGGIIFYLDGSGEHGLIAAPSDQSAGIVWGGCANGPCIETGAKATAFGTGQANTHKIVAALGGGSYAASLAVNLVLNGYSDWFLPSQNELNVMYWTIGPGAPAPLTNIGGFSSDLYWSSSEDNDYRAWFQNFDGGIAHSAHKNWTPKVRAVRAF